MKKLFEMLKSAVIESGGLKKFKEKKIRAIRINITENHQVAFYIDNEQFEIANINSGGLALNREKFKKVPKIKEKLKGI